MLRCTEIIGLLFLFNVNTSLGDESLLERAKSRFQGQAVTNLWSGIAGGQQDDVRVNVLGRASSFDAEHIYAQFLELYFSNHEKYFGDLLSGLTIEERTALERALEDRVTRHRSNRSKLTSLLDYKIVESIRNLPASPTTQNRLMEMKNLTDDVRMPSDQQVNDALIVYKRDELDAEQLFAEAIFEIIPSDSQKQFLRPFAKLGSKFTVHPFGKVYLTIDDTQLIKLKRSVGQEIGTTASIFREAIEKNPSIFTASEEEKRKMIPQDQLVRGWESQFRTLGLLSQEQLVRYLQLKGDIEMTETLEDWIERMPQDARRKMAREMLIKKVPLE
jgi:hypothetical protein